MRALAGAVYVPQTGESAVMFGLALALGCGLGVIFYSALVIRGRTEHTCPTPPPRGGRDVEFEAAARTAFDEHTDQALELVNGDVEFAAAVLVDLQHIDELADGGGSR